MIQNRNPSFLALLPELTGGVGNNDVHHDPKRPETTFLRPARVSTGVRTTYVVPGDWPEAPDHWFADDAVTYPLRKQNNVEYLIDGEPTYEAMVEAIETATGPEHFIVLLGWTLHVDFKLSEKGTRTPSSTRWLVNILKERVDLGVTLRVCVYDNQLGDGVFPPPVIRSRGSLYDLEQPRPDNPATAKVLYILDQGYRGATGCHHQKVLLVYGTEGLVGFFGGIDYNPDRVQPTPDGGPLHDVHARVTGEAADDLMVLATNRWNFAKPNPHIPYVGIAPPKSDYPTGKSLFDMNELLQKARAKPVPPPGPHRMVKIGHTVGNPELAKQQESGAFANVRKAIREAKKFIYIEDQYLWSVDFIEELATAAARVAHTTILFPPDNKMPANAPRHAALKRLKELVSPAVAEKISMYLITELFHSYIHAKMFIMDDEVAIIGSANCNNRGYFNDSEDNGVIADHAWKTETGPWAGKWWRLDLALAHKLRMELWAEHLVMPPEALVDGVAAEIHWRNPPKFAKVKPYRIDGKSWYDYEYASFYVLDAAIDPKP